MIWLDHIFMTLIHSVRVKHICVGKLTIICSNDGLSPGRRHDIIWTNAGIWNRNSNIFIGENTFKNVICEMSIFSRPQCVNMVCCDWQCLNIDSLRPNALTWHMESNNRCPLRRANGALLYSRQIMWTLNQGILCTDFRCVIMTPLGADIY